MAIETLTNFLSPDISQIRHSIRDIDDSYNNEWDVLAELLQNAVDAIRETTRGRGQIEITIDAQNQAIQVTDDGVGISPNDLAPLLRPFSTRKGGDERTIGEKGVGLTFAIFSCNYFEIKSGNDLGSARGVIEGAHAWKNSEDENALDLTVEKSTEPHVGTTVILRKVENREIFNLSPTQLEFVIRTRTAIGNTYSIWEEDITIDTRMIHTGPNGFRTEQELPFRYWLPTERIGPTGSISLDSFHNWLKIQDRSDTEKRSRLRGKIIFSTGKKDHSYYRTLRYYACYVPQRKSWDQLAIRNNLSTESQMEEEAWIDSNWFALFAPGITCSVKGMPTGIRIDNPHTGWAGYWGNLFILIEDNQLKFDIGRKSIHGKVAKIHQTYAREIFNDFRSLVTKYVAGDVSRGQTNWERDEVFAEIDSLPDNAFDCITFVKTPYEQEASVAAIFYEAIGRGIVKEIYPLISGYKEKYDLYAKWGTRNIVLEFKARLGSITKDFSDAQKYFDEINAVVCWEVTDQDRDSLHAMGIDVQELAFSPFADETDQHFPNATHIMSLGGTNPVYVIDMKGLLSRENR